MPEEPQANCIYLGPHGYFSGAEAGRMPVPDDMPGVKGVYVGGCVERGVGRLRPDSSKCPLAHAHNYSDDKHFGWVCFQTPEIFADESVRAHELAHINAPEQGHTAKWRNELARLGQPIPPRSRGRKAKRS